jgi:hypothetical protein
MAAPKRRPVLSLEVPVNDASYRVYVITIAILLSSPFMINNDRSFSLPRSHQWTYL